MSATSAKSTSPKIKVKILSNENFSQEDLDQANKQLQEQQQPQYNDPQLPGNLFVQTKQPLSQRNSGEVPPVEYRLSIDQRAMEIRSDSADAISDQSNAVVSATKKQPDAFADDPQSGSKTKKTKHKIYGNTPVVMGLLSEMWLIHITFILGFTYLMTFVAPQNYIDTELWNTSCYWKIGEIYCSQETKRWIN
jgi:hypothetical protein